MTPIQPRHLSSVPMTSTPPPALVERLELRGRVLDQCLALASSNVPMVPAHIYQVAIEIVGLVYGLTPTQLEAILKPWVAVDSDKES